ncbi:MAG: IPT/TIG domain-containing protein [Bacteroidetes bacterium]|nr:IPT/TIG domain-containing protein [Bacteroidota bacterium]
MTRLIFLLILTSNIAYCQVNIFPPESMYNGIGGMNGESIASWETNNRFENDAFGMFGTGDMRNTNPSNYPGASGTWNVMLNSPTEYFQMSGINTLNYTGIQLTVGIRKSTIAEDGSGLLVEFSIDSIQWEAIPLTLPSGPGTAGWHYVQPAAFLPAATKLHLRFTSITTTEFRLDDICLKGILPCPTLITSIFPVTGPPGTEVRIKGSGFSGTSQVLFGGIAAASFLVVNDSTLLAMVPSIAGSVQIIVSAGCNSNGNKLFEVCGASCNLNGSNLIISELCDPIADFATDRFIEIFNPTSNSIILDGWSVKAIANYSECESWELTGIIHPGEALTCGFTNPVYGGPHDFSTADWNATVTASCCSFWNGNRRDGAALYQGTVKVDEALFENTSVGWFNDRCLLRIDTICRPNPTENSAEWIVSDLINMAGVTPSSPGEHITHCPGIAPSVFADPYPAEACEGGSLSFHAAALGPGQPFTFTWFVLESAGNWDAIVPSGIYSVMSAPTGSTLLISGLQPSMNGIQYYCKAYNQGGGCSSVSDAFKLGVIALPATSAIFHY